MLVRIDWMAMKVSPIAAKIRLWHTLCGCVCVMWQTVVHQLSQIRRAKRMNKLWLKRTFRPANDLCTSSLKSHVSRVPDFLVNGKLVSVWACCSAYATMTIVIQPFFIICVHVPRRWMWLLWLAPHKMQLPETRREPATTYRHHGRRFRSRAALSMSRVYGLGFSSVFFSRTFYLHVCCFIHQNGFTGACVNRWRFGSPGIVVAAVAQIWFRLFLIVLVRICFAACTASEPAVCPIHRIAGVRACVRVYLCMSVCSRT